jgi:hypothetical protein
VREVADGQVSSAVVEAVVALPFGLPVDEACLGTTESGIVDDIPVDVVLPGLAMTSDGSPYLDAPRVQAKLSEVTWEERLHDPLPWGSVMGWRPGPPLTEVRASIKHILLRTALPPLAESEHIASAQALVNRLYAHVWGWIHTIGDWCEVSTAQYLPRSHGPGAGSLAYGPELTCWSYDGQKTCRLGHDLIISGVVIGRPVLDLPSWRKILTKSNKEKSPPTEHLLLRDSLASLFVGDTRRAVLDAATSAEIGLTALLDRQIGTVPAPVKTVVQQCNRDLGRLTATLKKTFGLSLSPDIEEGLIKPRNRAIHAGISPSEDVARRAINTARGIVDLISPRTDLLLS